MIVMDFNAEGFIYNGDEMYNLGFDDIIGIFYDFDNNYFIDEDGFVIYDIHNIITPNDVFLFKKRKEDMFVRCQYDRKVGVEIYWPEEEYYLSRTSGLLYKN